MTSAKRLIDWYEANKRDLPWRNTSDPYLIWVSEIILQQTRIDQGIDYYYRFVEKFPDVHSLADSKIEEVLKIWQGLGYYTRARNMHATARFIKSHNNGIFPNTYQELLTLKGIGPYTAAAIASFAFGERTPVVDGNVERVIARLYKVYETINTSAGKKKFSSYALDFMNDQSPALFNQAIMEIGALICNPQNPLCDECPLAVNCVALKEHLIQQLPVKNKKVKIRHRYFNYLIINLNESLYLIQRLQKDIWNSLYEFPLIETNKKINKKTIQESTQWQAFFSNKAFTIDKVSEPVEHQLSHQKIHAVFYHIHLNEPLTGLGKNYQLIPFNKLKEFAIPRLIDRYIKNTKYAKYFI
jgi:A/G-specific adenine glycosylase